MERLLALVRRLRGPDGCPWDRNQTLDSLRPFLIEEAAEAADALGGDDPRAMADELGDLLGLIAMYAAIGEETGRFGYGEIEAAVCDKLVRRHPHVFGDAPAGDLARIEASWEALKAAERGGAPVPPEARVPRSLPALARAAALSEAMAWTPEAELLGRRLEDLAGDPETVGRVLLVAAQLARRCGVDPELALRDATEARLRAEPKADGS